MEEIELVAVPCSFKGTDGKEKKSYNFYSLNRMNNVAIAIRPSFKSGYVAILAQGRIMEKLPEGCRVL